MNGHGKKMVAPIAVTAVLILYYVLYFLFLITRLDGLWRWALGVLPLIFSAVTVWVCAERIREIKEGEEDDLGKY